MSKFQSTVSTVAALASIFGAGAAGWKLAADSNRVTEPVTEVGTTVPEKTAEEPPAFTLAPPVAPPPVTEPEAAATTESPEPAQLPVAPPPAVPAPPAPPTTTP